MTCNRDARSQQVILLLPYLRSKTNAERKEGRRIHRLRPTPQLSFDLQELPRRLLVQPLTQTAQRPRDLKSRRRNSPLFFNSRDLLLSSTSLGGGERDGRVGGTVKEGGLRSFQGSFGFDDVGWDLKVGVEGYVDLRT